MNSIDDPYSDSQLASARTQIEAAHGEALSIVRDCYQRLCDRLSGTEYETETADEVAYALSARILELSAMSLLCLRSGSVPSAKALIRAVLEAAYKVCALRKEPSNLDQLFSDDIAARLLLKKQFHAYKKEKNAKNLACGIESKIDEMTLQKAKKIEPFEWSRRAGMTDFHRLFYPWLSSYTHTNVAAINHYFDATQNYALQVGPEDTHLRMTSIILSRCLIVVLRRLEGASSEASETWYEKIEQRLSVFEAA